MVQSKNTSALSNGDRYIHKLLYYFKISCCRPVLSSTEGCVSVSIQPVHKVPWSIFICAFSRLVGSRSVGIDIDIVNLLFKWRGEKAVSFGLVNPEQSIVENI